VAICSIKRRVGDAALVAGIAVAPEVPASGRRVAVVGAGPAGLSAAWFLRRLGHAVTIFEAESEPGGGLRHGCSPEILPQSVLVREIARLLAAGIDLRCGVRIGRDRDFASVRAEFDAVVLAAGIAGIAAAAEFSGISLEHGSVVADRHTGETALPGVFTVGDMLRPTGRMAARAVGDGRHAAVAADQFLRGQAVSGEPRRFHSRMGPSGPGERAEMMKEASAEPRLQPGAADGGFTAAEAMREAARCLHCDCRKPFSCKLREYAEEYGARHRHHAPEVRPEFSRNLTHPDLVHEPGKCIRCGLCVRISRAGGEAIGMAFLQRGNDLRISPPFGEPLSEALSTSAAACVEACPTGALCWR
jgi:ferredoxin